MKRRAEVTGLSFLVLLLGCSSHRPDAKRWIDAGPVLPDGDLASLVPDSCTREVGSVEITPIVTLSTSECDGPRIRLIYVIPGRLALGESANVEVQTHDLSGAARVTFAVRDEARNSAAIELSAASGCAADSTACEEVTCASVDEDAGIELDDGRRAGEARVAVTVRDDVCRDTEEISVGCVEPVEARARCGDGEVEKGEQCDGKAGLAAPDLQHCDPATCTIVPLCGNGIREGDEQCDDGNAIERDGCAPDCTPSIEPYCGDGFLDEGEVCDKTAGLLDPAVQACGPDCGVAAICGNGYTEPPEACDDGNDIDGDGCQADCTLTPIPVCGNGLLEGKEGCDDGNTVAGDGCDSSCYPEPRRFCVRHPRAWLCRFVDLFRDRFSAQP